MRQSEDGSSQNENAFKQQMNFELDPLCYGLKAYLARFQTISNTGLPAVADSGDKADAMSTFTVSNISPETEPLLTCEKLKSLISHQSFPSSTHEDELITLTFNCRA